MFASTLSGLGSRVLEHIAMLESKGALEKAAIQSELDTLREQMRPHFIFNTLNGIAAMIPLDGERATEMITKLSDLYRLILDYRRKQPPPRFPKRSRS